MTKKRTRQVLSQSESKQNTKPSFNITFRTQGQRNAWNVIHQNRVTFLSGKAGTAKAQPLDCKVLTESGWKRMGDISVGDMVRCPDNSLAAVTGVFPQGRVETYTIEMEDGGKTEACGDHLWEVFSDKFDGGVKILQTKDLALLKSVSGIKDRLSLRLPEPLELGGSDENLPLDPYLLGALLGDGHIGHSIHFSSVDDQILERVSACLNKFDCHLKLGNRCNYYVRKNLNGRPANSNPNPVKEILKELNLVGLKSHQKFIPEHYLTASVESRWKLLQGLFDTDGCAGSYHKTKDTNGSPYLSSTSERLISDASYLVKSLGGTCFIHKYKSSYVYSGEKRQGRTNYKLWCRFPDSSKVFYLERKAEQCGLWHGGKRTLKRKIKSVNLSGEKECQCIMIDHPEHLYITDDFIVTHNTFLAVAYALKAALEWETHQRVYVIRPAVEAGERNGALPGAIEDKMRPFLMPIFSVVDSLCGGDQLLKQQASKILQILAVGYIRGVTFEDSVVIMDEAQNLTKSQMRLFLTRLGPKSKLILCGDTQQSDIDDKSVLLRTAMVQSKHDGVGWYRFGPEDQVRDPLVNLLDDSMEEI